MIGFKKDNDKHKSIKKYVSTFISGFVISLFLVLFILIMVINYLRNNNIPTIIDTSSGTTSESITSSSDEFSSPDESSSSEYIDPYINEKAILDNLLSLAKEYEPDDLISVMMKIISIYSLVIMSIYTS